MHRYTFHFALATILGASCTLSWARAPQTGLRIPQKPVPPVYLKAPVRITEIEELQQRYTALSTETDCTVTPHVSRITDHDGVGNPIYPTSVAAVNHDQLVYFDSPSHYSVVHDDDDLGNSLRVIDLGEDPPMATIGTSPHYLSDLSIGPGAKFAGCTRDNGVASVYGISLLPYSREPFITAMHESLCWGMDTDDTYAYLLSGSGGQQHVVGRAAGEPMYTPFFFDKFELNGHLDEIVSLNGDLYFSLRTHNPGELGLDQWLAMWPGTGQLQQLAYLGKSSARIAPVSDMEAHQSGIVGLRSGRTLYDSVDSVERIDPQLELIASDGSFCSLKFEHEPLVDEYSDWVDIDVFNVDADTIEIIIVDRRLKLNMPVDGYWAPMYFVSEHYGQAGGQLLRVTVNLPTGY